MGIDSSRKRCARWMMGCSLLVTVSAMADSEPPPTNQQSTAHSIDRSITEHLDSQVSRAEQWAMMMREDAERILAFQRAYDEAHKRLFPNGVLIDTRTSDTCWYWERHGSVKHAWQNC